MKHIIFCLVAMLMLCGAALAQPTPPSGSNLGGNATLSVSTSSSNVALPANLSQFQFVQVINDGTSEAFVAQGNGSVVATTSSIPLPAGSSTYFWVQPGNTNIAAITAANVTTVRVLQWNGAPLYSAGGQSAYGPSANTAPLAVGSVSFQFSVTSSDQALSGSGLSLPGKLCFTNPQQTYGSSGINTTYVNINWNGNSSVSAPIDQIAPGIVDICWYVPTNTIPHLSVNSGSGPVTIGVQQ
jgi:hypothetical protein